MSTQGPFSYFSTNIFQALWVLTEDFFTIGNGDRALVPNFGIMITDSAFPTDVPRGVIIRRAQQTRELGVKLLVIGVGKKPRRADLVEVSGGPQNLLMVTDYYNLRGPVVMNWLLARLKTMSKYHFVESHLLK